MELVEHLTDLGAGIAGILQGVENDAGHRRAKGREAGNDGGDSPSVHKSQITLRLTTYGLAIDSVRTMIDRSKSR